jgi:hypothetical protein
VTDGAAARPGTTPIWRFGLRLPAGACIPDVLGNLWLRNQSACSSLSTGDHWQAESVFGVGSCRSLGDETVEVPAGKFVARQIVCEWTQKDDPAKRSFEYWYSLQAGYMVQIIRKAADASGAVQELSVEKLEHLALK